MFCSVCAGRHSAGELLRFFCCVTMALLKEPKDKLSLPYEPFAESGTHNCSSHVQLVKSGLLLGSSAELNLMQLECVNLVSANFDEQFSHFIW